MRIEELRVYESLDPEIAGGSDDRRRYLPFHHVQRLGIFRTPYSVSHLALKCARIGSSAKLEAYQRHVMQIEKFLQQGKGGEGTRRTEREVECDYGHKHTVVDEVPWRLPHSYLEFLNAGLGANEEVILIGLKGRVLDHHEVRWGEGFSEDMQTWEWLSEVALGVAKNHNECYIFRTKNPFKLGWRSA